MTPPSSPAKEAGSRGKKKHAGYIFNIQHYSLHDGAGIRTVVFLKGCPLRCKWCSNPESQNMRPELFFSASRCIGSEQCSLCTGQCSGKAIYGEGGEIRINRPKCSSCFQCVRKCPSGALAVSGEFKNTEEILDAVERDSIFYRRSGGGLTLSGGEPLFQADFAVDILKEAKKRYLHTAVETCGYVKWEVLSQAAEYLDEILYDIKGVNDEKHMAFTGVSNRLILDNFCRLCERYPEKDLTVRIPVIPSFNDTEEEMDEILSWIQKVRHVKYEFLPYHQFGRSKYDCLGIPCPLEGVNLGKGIKEYISRINLL